MAERTPLVFVHTWPMEPAHLGRLVPHLGPDQPVCALAYPPDELLPSLEHVDDWVDYARPLVDELPVRPPYRLAGWSFGGVVALELSRRLAADGVPIDSVDLIDTWIPRGHPRTVFESVLYHAVQILGLHPAERGAEVRAVARRAPAQLRKAAEQQARRLGRALGVGPDEPRHRVDPQIRAIWVPFFKYRPERYLGRVTISSCAPSVARNDGDPSLGWSRWLVQGFETVAVDGDHRSMWAEPHVASVARALTRG